MQKRRFFIIDSICANVKNARKEKVLVERVKVKTFKN
jgi:hypothetical protein